MSKLTKKIASVGLSVTTAVWLSGVTMLVPVASAQTNADLQAQITALLAQIATLQAQLQTPATGTPASCSFTRNLTVGSKGDDVKCLQQWLNANGYPVATTGVGSAGNESMTFGSLTRAALAKYQAAKGISPAVGYFGPLTRSSVGSVVVTPGPTPTPVPVGTDLAVALASDNPGERTIGSGTSFNPALKVSLTAGSKAVKVTSLTVMKSGFVTNTNLNGVDVIDSKGVRHGNVVTSINADNSILLTMTTDPVMIAAGTTETLTVRFNLVRGDYTGTVSFRIATASAIAADTTAVGGTFPVQGKTMNIVNGGSSLASTTLDVQTSTGSSTLNVSATDLQEITRFRIRETSSNEGAYLYSLKLYNYENAADADYKDVTLEDQSGTVLAVAQSVNKYVTFTLATPYFIDKGLTKDFIVKAKIVDGASRKINFAVYNDYDVDLRGANTQVSVIPGGGTNDTTFPIGSGFNIQTIGSGSVTLTRAADSPSASTVPGATNVVLAKYNVKPTGEDFELRQVSFYISTTSAATAAALTGTVFVKVNGATVFSIAASSISTTAAATRTLSSYPILKSGVDSVITVEASIASTAASTDTYTVENFDLIQGKRLITNDLVDPGVGATDGLGISVKAAALKVTTIDGPTDTLIAGAVGATYGKFVFDASAGGEDVKVTKVIVDHVEAGSLTEVGNLLLYKDSDTSPLSTSASTATNASTVTFTLSQPLLVTRGTTVTLTLKADALSGTNAHTYRVTSSSDVVVATGATTGNALTHGSDITFQGNGQVLTHAAAGTLTLSLVSGDSTASPVTNQVVTPNSTDKVVFVFKMTSQTETQKITSLKLTATSSGSTSLATTTLKNLKLREGSATASPVATKSQFDTCASGTCTITFSANENIFSQPVPLTGLTVYVTADVAPLGTADIGNSYKFLIASSTGDVAVKGNVSGSTSGTRTGTPTAAGFVFVVPARVAIEAVSPTTAAQVGLASGQTVGVFKVTNNGSFPIYVTSTATTTNGGSATATLGFQLLASAVGGTQGDVTVTYATGSTIFGATGASSTVSFNIIGVASEANRQIDGGSYRYITIRTGGVTAGTGGTSANNDTFQFSVSALGNLLFYAKESEVGYSMNPSSDSDLSDAIDNLYIDGKPSLATVTAKS